MVVALPTEASGEVVNGFRFVKVPLAGVQTDVPNILDRSQLNFGRLL